MRNGLTSFHIKLIAAVCMFIDHFNSIFLPQVTAGAYRTESFLSSLIIDNIKTVYTIQDIFILLGRLAFPLYIYLLIEGFTHTKSKTKYAIRLFLFAIISEIPFDLAFSGTVFAPRYNNVFITLFLGFIAIWGIELLHRFCTNLKGTNTKFWAYILQITGTVSIALVIAYISELAMCDYGASGVIAITVMYLLRKKPVLGYIGAVLTIAIINLSMSTIFALIGTVFIFVYNGNKGRPIKYAFYAFYPAHLLFLAVCAELLIYFTK